MQNVHVWHTCMVSIFMISNYSTSSLVLQIFYCYHCVLFVHHLYLFTIKAKWESYCIETLLLKWKTYPKVRTYLTIKIFTHVFLFSVWQGDIASCSGTYLYLWSINGEEIACVNTAPPQNNQQILCLAMSQVHITAGGHQHSGPYQSFSQYHWIAVWLLILFIKFINVNCFLNFRCMSGTARMSF